MQYSAEEMPANFNGDSTVSFVWRIPGTIDWCLDFVAATGSFLPIKQILQETWMKKWVYVTLAQDCSGISRGIRADQNYYLGLKSVYKSQHSNWSRSNSWRWLNLILCFHEILNITNQPIRRIMDLRKFHIQEQKIHQNMRQKNWWNGCFGGIEMKLFNKI